MFFILNTAPTSWSLRNRLITIALPLSFFPVSHLKLIDADAQPAHHAYPTFFSNLECRESCIINAIKSG
jgi:hypothetical protein